MYRVNNEMINLLKIARDRQFFDLSPWGFRVLW